MRYYTKSLIAVIQDSIASPRFGCEVGVWKGETSRFLMEAFPDLFMLCVDRYQEVSDEELHTDRGLVRLCRSSDAMKQALCDAVGNTEFASDRRLLLVGESVLAAKFVPDGVLDFVFIDANHLYDDVKADLESWTPKVKPGGLLTGHDYGGRGDRRRQYGVKRAVDELAERLGREVQTRRGLLWWMRK